MDGGRPSREKTPGTESGREAKGCLKVVFWMYAAPFLLLLFLHRCVEDRPAWTCTETGVRLEDSRRVEVLVPTEEPWRGRCAGLQGKHHASVDLLGRWIPGDRVGEIPLMDEDDADGANAVVLSEDGDEVQPSRLCFITDIAFGDPGVYCPGDRVFRNPGGRSEPDAARPSAPPVADPAYGPEPPDEL